MLLRVKKNTIHAVFVTTRDHREHLKGLVEAATAAGTPVHVAHYWELMRLTRLPRAVYIFCDLDRLSPAWMELAVRMFDRVREAGLPALNDPRGFLPRAGLIRKMRGAGLIDYTCWLPMLDEWPDRFPVFLRTMAAHRGVFGGLIETEEAARETLAQALAAGHVISDLGFIQFQPTERDANGATRKYAAFRLGDRIIPAPPVSEQNWLAKHGSVAAATDEAYARDLAEFDINPHEAAIRAVFDLAQLEFGRADFGLHEGRVKVFEINTNPTIGLKLTHPNADRNALIDRHGKALVAALKKLTPDDPGALVEMRRIPKLRPPFLRPPRIP
ncbi:MAG: hypothetical protein ABNH26_09775 [Celeribacter sp.]